MFGGIQADQSISFQAMEKKLKQFVDIIRQDPAVQSVSRLYRRRPDQFGFRVCRAEAAARAPRRDAEGDGPTTAETQRGRGRPPVPAAGDGHPGRRARELRAIPVYPAGRQHGRHLRMGAQARGGIAEGAAVDRCQSRPAAKGARDRSGHRPGYGRAPRAHRQPDRQYPLRCVRPTSGVGDLRCAKPIPCDHGGGARILAEPGHPEPDLCQHQRRCGRRHEIDQRTRRNGADQSADREQRQCGDDHRPDRRRHGAQPGQQRAR